MKNIILYILTLPERSDRREALIPQLIREGINYEFVEGIKENVTFRAVSQGHKKIIQAAKDRGDEMVFVAEDDAVICEGGWEYFLANIPAEFDLYLGACSNGYPGANGFVADFRGMFWYICHSRFYNRFLQVEELAHIDTALSELKETEYKLIDKFICRHADGYSDNNHQLRTYGHLWVGREFYTKNKDNGDK